MVQDYKDYNMFLADNLLPAYVRFHVYLLFSFRVSCWKSLKSLATVFCGGH